MKRFRLFRKAQAAVFALSTVLHGGAFAGVRISSALATGGGAGNGFIQYTQPVLHCDPSGRCRPGPETWRDSRQTATVENQRIYVSTVDRIASPERIQRVKFSVSDISKGSQRNGTQGIEPLPPLNLNVDAGSTAYNDLMKMAPSIGAGALDAIDNLRASAAAAARLQADYQRSMDGFRTANDHLVQGALAQQKLNEQISTQSRIFSAAAMASPQAHLTQNSAYQEYVAATEDPFSFREYELIGTTSAESLAAAKAAIQNRQPRKAIELAQPLLHQKDARLRAEAARALDQGFNDGILRTQSFGANTPSVLDVARFKTPQHSPAGEIVRHLANKAQLAWLDSRALASMTDEQGSAYFTALVALRASDTAFINKQAAAGLSLAKLTDNLLDCAMGVAHGTASGLYEAVRVLPAVGIMLAEFGAETLKESLTNPLAIQQQMNKVALALPGVVSGMAVHYWSLAKQIAGGSYEKKGEAIGQLASEVFIAFITEGAGSAVKGVSVAARTGKFAEIAAQFGASAAGPVLELTERVGTARVQALASLAASDHHLAVQMVEAVQKLSVGGASDAGAAYLDAVLGTGKPLGASVKSASAITDAVNNGVIATSEHLSVAKELQGALDKVPRALKIRYVGDNGKVVVIGRSMDSNVIPIEKILRQNGVDSEVFKLSDQAERQWKLWKDEFPNSDVPVEKQMSGLGYLENADWIQKKIEAGYTIIDAGNPQNAGPSLYYDMEDEIIQRALENKKPRGAR